MSIIGTMIVTVGTTVIVQTIGNKAFPVNPLLLCISNCRHDHLYILRKLKIILTFGVV